MFIESIEGKLILFLAQVLNLGLFIYMWIVIIRALISWVSPNPYNPIVQFLYRATEPVLWRVRRIIPIGGFGIDFSPLIVILVIIFLRSFVVKTLVQLAYRLG
ncbi:MAG: YggT family protein [Deltaproteobacteria bacterium]|nr:YggT family protein [Deltaproteobacteria bacterium]